MQFEAEVRQVKSMVDGSVNVTFNLPEYHVSQAQELMAMIGDMVTIDCLIAGYKQDDRQNSRRKVETRTERES